MTTIQWVDKYRPMYVGDIISHQPILQIIKNMLKTNDISHMLFNGLKGTGKTTTIHAIINELYANDANIMTLKLNASNHRGIDVVRQEIKSFVTTQMIFSTKPKLVVLDEADAMTMDAQLALRRMMDKYSSNAKFCIICNYIRKIHPALVSRCMVFRFKPLDKISIEKRLSYIIQEEGLTISQETIDKLISMANNDMRRAIFMLQALSLEKEQNINTLCQIFKFPTDTQISHCLCILNNSLIQRIKELINFLNKNGFHLETIIDIYFDYLLKNKEYDKIVKLAQIKNHLSGEYTLELQVYALMSIFDSI